MKASHRIYCCLAWAILFAGIGGQANAADPLHHRIDRAVSDTHVGDVAASTNDYEFVRRIYLDLVGRIPTTDELQSFVADDDSSKRELLVNELLASDEFDEHIAGVLDVLFMERRGGTRIPQQEWSDFLRAAVKQKWTFDRIVGQIVTADGTGNFRGAAKFLLERQVEPNALTRDVGRIFFGRDLQCAQCHDHPNISEYEQAEYYGIFAFVNRSYLFEDDADNKKSYVGEKADGDAEYTSVFLPEDGTARAIPNLLDGLTLDVEEPQLPGHEAYLVLPSKTAAGVPKFSRRSQLARLITHPDNEHFAKNAANRFWALMLGRGLVQPVDFHHGDNPASHPKLLKLLADEFVAMGFDFRELLRQIALSETYQRSIDFPAESPTSLAELEQRSAKLQALLSVTDSDDQDKQFEQQLKTRRATLADVDMTISASAEKAAEIDQRHVAMQETVAAAEQQLISMQSQIKALDATVVAAKRVSQLAPEDKSLADALANYEGRAATVKKDAEAKNTELETKKKELDALTEQLHAQELQLAKLRADRVGLADMVAEARGAVSVFRAQQRKRIAARDDIKRQLGVIDLHRDYLAKRESARVLSERYAQLTAIAESPAEEHARLADLLAMLQADISEKELAFVSRQQDCNSTTAACAQEKKTIEDLSDAIAKSEAVASKLGDQQLQEAVGVLKAKQQLLLAQLAVHEQQLAEEQESLQLAQQQLSGQIAERERIAKQQTELRNRIEKQNLERAATKADWLAAITAAELAGQRLRASWERRYVVRSLVPLTPEQLAGSTMAALGLRQRYQAEAENEWQKNFEEKKKDGNTNEQQGKTAEIDEAKTREEITELAKKRIDTVVSTYVSMFAAPGGAPQDVFSATADQALFFANDGRFQNWLAPADGTLLKRLQSLEDASQVAEELYLTILSRPATDDEKSDISNYLETRQSDRNKALRELAWGLLSSLEFRFNH